MSENIGKYLVKFTQAEYDEQNIAGFEAIREENERDSAPNAQKQRDFLEQRRQRDRELAAERKQCQCEREKLLEISQGIWKEDGTLKKKRVQFSPF
jgi:hypothetical protein